MRTATPLAIALLSISSSAHADVTAYQDDRSAWLAATGGTDHIIDFEFGDTPDNLYLNLGNNHYYNQGYAAGPVLDLLEDHGGDSGRFNVWNPGPPYADDALPTSGEMVLATDNPATGGQGGQFNKGRVKVEFVDPVFSIGAFFIDVEAAYAATGIELDGVLYAFDAPQANNSQVFFGITSDTPFTIATLVLGDDHSVPDGVFVDDLAYVVPSPGTLATLGCVALFASQRRR